MFVLRSDRGGLVMFRALMEEAAALASISLFLATVAVWAQLFSNY